MGAGFIGACEKFHKRKNRFFCIRLAITPPRFLSGANFADFLIGDCRYHGHSQLPNAIGWRRPFDRQSVPVQLKGEQAACAAPNLKPF